MLRHTLIVVLFMLLGGVAPAEEKAPDTAADVPPSVEATAPATEPVATPAPHARRHCKEPGHVCTQRGDFRGFIGVVSGGYLT